MTSSTDKPLIRRRQRPCFGTWLTITLKGVEDLEAADLAISEGFRLAQDIHDAMSVQTATSDLNAIARLRVGESLDLRPHTAAVLRLALELAEESGGLFNPISPMDEADTKADWRDIRFEGGTRISVAWPLRISLDGIAKGYGADRVCEYLKRIIGCDIIVDAGGDLSLDCETPEEIGLRDPKHPDRIARSVQLASGGIASSAGYGGISELWVHGKPRDWQGSTTVIASNCALADALTKVAAINPKAEILAQKNVEVIQIA